MIGSVEVGGGMSPEAGAASPEVEVTVCSADMLLLLMGEVVGLLELEWRSCCFAWVFALGMTGGA